MQSIVIVIFVVMWKKDELNYKIKGKEKKSMESL